ncbi:hypothetical protein E6O75_ATG10899 [Venturia nashicola]|uniref:Uncharacterized protein n=1 Tax=Venturia nashicola TaxID=86259 RepID=A0A4Z1P2L9_9PEZI|nr:hypothetical protein E6O75_ATG10899 [Venturia nashicola]
MELMWLEPLGDEPYDDDDLTREASINRSSPMARTGSCIPFRWRIGHLAAHNIGLIIILQHPYAHPLYAAESGLQLCVPHQGRLR